MTITFRRPSFRQRARRWFCGEPMEIYVHKIDHSPRPQPSCCKLFGPAVRR